MTHVEGHVSERIFAALAVRTSNSTDAVETAAAVAALCEEIGQALAPIVGQGGVAALYKRSLFLTARDHPMLSGLHADVQGVMDVSPLTSRLTSLSQSDAARVGAALLLSFYELLGSLVGSSLTERLLRSLWNRPLSDPPASEASP